MIEFGPPIYNLRQDHFDLISISLTPSDLGRCTEVCALWKQTFDNKNPAWEAHAIKAGATALPRELQNLFNTQEKIHLLQIIADFAGIRHPRTKDVFANPYPQQAFGKTEWMQYIAEPSDVPRLPANIWEILKKPCPFWKKKTVEQTHTLMLIPQKITILLDNISITGLLTIYNLGILVGSTNGGMGIRLRDMEGTAFKQYEDLSIEKSYWILITNKIIPDSDYKTYPEQEEFIRKYPQYAIPKAIEAIATVLLNHAHLRNRADPSYDTRTRCCETTHHPREFHYGINPWSTDPKYRQITVAQNIHSKTLNINSMTPSDYNPGDTGITAVRRF